MTDRRRSAGTTCVWGGETQSLIQGATQVPVVHSVAFGYPDVDTWLQVARGERPGHIYSRNTNPTVCRPLKRRCVSWKGHRRPPVWVKTGLSGR